MQSEAEYRRWESITIAARLKKSGVILCCAPYSSVQLGLYPHMANISFSILLALLGIYALIGGAARLDTTISLITVVFRRLL